MCACGWCVGGVVRVCMCQCVGGCLHVIFNTLGTRGRVVFQRFASTDAKQYIFCVNGTKNAYIITKN